MGDGRGRPAFHLDVKAENVLVLSAVRGSNDARGVNYHLLDFGSMRNQDEWNKSDGVFETTFDTLPSPLQRTVDLGSATSDKRVRVKNQAAHDNGITGAALDRHQLGRIVLEMLESDGFYAPVREHISRDDREMLREVARCLLVECEDGDPAKVDDKRLVEELFRYIAEGDDVGAGEFQSGLCPSSRHTARAFR